MINLRDTLSLRTTLTLILAILVSIFYTSNFAVEALLIYVPFLGLFFSKTRYVSYVFIGRALLPITFGFLALWGWESFHNATQYEYLARNALQNYAAIQDFFTILSVLYAICIAFLLWKGLTDYDNLRIVLRDEASTIQSINEFSHYLDEEGENGHIVDEIRDLFIRYIANLKSGRKIIISRENERFLKIIVGLIAKLQTKDENDKIALSEIMKEVSALSHIRASRASYMETRMSSYLLSVLVLISVFLLLPFLIKEPSAGYILHILIFSLASFFSFLFITLLDINDPFDGYWQIKVDAFADVERFLKEDKLDFN